MLYIVSTPIGNLKDITLRAIDTLKEADLILAEDTRHTSTLLNAYNIKTRMISFNDHNKERKTRQLIEELKTRNIALVSDAGTPGVSDPGFYIVRECVKNNIKVIPIPGASALLAGLVCSGLPTDKFTFVGFLPKKDSKKRDMLDSTDSTLIAYESPYRIIKTLEMLKVIKPEANIVIGRELTKKFEEFLRGTPNQLLQQLKDKQIKGEFVLIING